jgi:hypothetical protein
VAVLIACLQTLAVHDWLDVYQDMQGFVAREQNYSLLRYSAYPLLAFHHHFSSPGTGPGGHQHHGDQTHSMHADKHKILWPRSGYELSQGVKNNRQILATVMEVLVNLGTPRQRHVHSTTP